jgi:hypothetical protein
VVGPVHEASVKEGRAIFALNGHSLAATRQDMTWRTELDDVAE